MAQMTIGSATEREVSQALHDRYSGLLRIIRVMFVELDEIVADGEEVGDAEWASWSMQWSADMSRLPELIRARHHGELTVYQEALLTDILALLVKEEPRLVELRLARPSVRSATPEREAAAIGGQSTQV